MDVDTAYFEDFTYSIAEIECIVSSEAEIKTAENKIFKFLRFFNISKDRKLYGKLIAYLHECRLDHFQALKVANVVS